MTKKTETTMSRNNMDKVMRDLSLKKETPKSVFIVLVMIYLTATVFTVLASRSAGAIYIFDPYSH